MKKYLIVFITAVLVISGCESGQKREISLVDQINEKNSKSATSYGAEGSLLQKVRLASNIDVAIFMPEKDSKGWSIVLPTEESRLIYVSSSEGDDSKASYYTTAEIVEPINPSGITAFKTINEAMKLVRKGHPDWVLLKKGDEWLLDKTIYPPSGQSKEAPFVFTAYGEGGSRPLLKTGRTTAFFLKGDRKFIALIGIDMYADKRDPDSENFVGWDDVGRPKGFMSITSTLGGTGSILLEDNVFRFYAGNVQFNGKNNKNIVLRRNQILNSYSVNSHSQGLYIESSSVLLEENLIDHNGWYKQRFSSNASRAEGQATKFNHNAYLTNLTNSLIIGNIITRSSSIGLKFANGMPSKNNYPYSYNIWIDNNLVVDGEVGFSIGGNKDYSNGFRFRDIRVTDNVLINIGHSQATNRTLAWHIEADDWDGGVISGNYSLYNDNEVVNVVNGINLKGRMREVDVYSNVFFGLNQGPRGLLRMLNSEDKAGVRLYDNLTEVPYTTQNRKDIVTFLENQGELGNLEELIVQVKKQSQGNWNEVYTAGYINSYLKSQFK